MKNKTCSYLMLLLLIIAFQACTETGTKKQRSSNDITINGKNESNVQKDEDLPKGDTVLFNPDQAGRIELLSFDDNNSIELNDVGINLVVFENKDDSYKLVIKKGEKVFFSKDTIQGLTKVFFDGNNLLFSVFKSVTEDGNNEGQAVWMNIKDNSVKTFPKILKNTCNPVLIKDRLYFIDDLNLIETDLNLNILKNFRISYLTNNKDLEFEYLDTYGICGLSKSKGQDEELLIVFTPYKTSECKYYGGIIQLNNTVIAINDKLEINK